MGVYAWNRNNKNNQRWKIISLGRGKFSLKGNHSHKCLDNTGKARSGRGYHLWNCNKKNKNQHLSIMKRSKNRRYRRSRSSRAPIGWGMIKGKGNLCIQATRKGRITQGICSKKYKTLWRFIRIGRVYKIENKNGQMIEVAGSKKNNGAPIYAWSRNKGKNQKWKYISVWGGKFELKNVNSNRCLDNTGKARNKVGYHQWNCSKINKNQHFRFIRTRVNRRNKYNRRSYRKTRSYRKRKSRNNRKKVPKNWGMIKGKGNLCIHSTKKGRVTQGPCKKDDNNALWKFIRIGN